MNKTNFTDSLAHRKVKSTAKQVYLSSKVSPSMEHDHANHFTLIKSFPTHRNHTTLYIQLLAQKKVGLVVSRIAEKLVFL